jgi:hypothetical protein
MNTEQLDRVLKAAGSLLKAEAPAAAQDASSLGKVFLAAFPGFVASAERLAELSDGVKAFMRDLPKMVKRVVSSVNETFEVSPGEVADSPRGVTNIGRDLAKALKRLRRSIEDKPLQKLVDETVENLEALDDLADALRQAEDGGRVEVALFEKAMYARKSDGGGNGEGHQALGDEKGDSHRRRLHAILKRYGIDPGVSSLAQVLPIEDMCAAIIADKDDIPVVLWEAESPSGILPALKVPDPRFLVERLEDGKVAGLLSRRKRMSRISKPQALVNEVASTGADGAFVWAVVSQDDPVHVESMAELSDQQREGLDQKTAEEFSTEENIYFIPLKLVVIFEPPLRLKKPPMGRRYGAEVDFDNDIEKGRQLSIERLLQEQRRREIHGFIDDPDPSALRRVPASKLKQLDRQLHQLFARSFEDTDVTAAEGVTREDVVNAHVFVLRELARRDIDTVETDQLAKETAPFMGDELTKSERFAEINSGTDGKLEPVELQSVLGAFDKPMMLRTPAVYVVGSVCNHGVTKNDIDLLIRGPFSDELRHVIQFRLGRALDPSMSKRVQFLDDELGGPFTNHVPLYDLVLVPHEDRTVKQMREEAAKQDDPLMDWPAKFGKLPAVLQFHFRGKTLHADLRFKVGDHLVGWTLALQKAGAVPKVDTIAEAKKIANAFKVGGSRYTKDMQLPSRVFATPKSRQPLVWMNLGDAVFEPGEVGATRNEPGVYVEVMKPKVEWGLQKPSSHEYFITGDPDFAGTLTFRLLVGEGNQPEGRAGEGEAFWTSGFAKTALPSVLKRRAVNTKSMPPLGQSAMPQTLMRVTPKEFRFWEADSEAEARKVRDALVDAKVFTESNVVVDDGEYRRVEQKVLTEAYDPEDEEIVTKAAAADFALSWQWWKGQTVVRATPSRQVWHLMIAGKDGVDRADDYQLQKDPLSGEKAITAVLEEGGTDSDQALKFEGDVEPGKDVEGLLANDTKNTPSRVSIQDNGKVEFLEDGPTFKKLRFKGKKLKGIFTLVVEEPGSKLWQFSPGEDPGRAVPDGEEKLTKDRPITEGELAELEKAYQTRRDGTQVWNPARVSDEDDKGGEREELRPPAVFQPMKPAPRDSVAFTDPDDASGEVFTDQLIRQGVQVEPKYNGFRGVAERWDAREGVSEGGTMVFTEDSKRDIAGNLKGLSEELRKVGGDFVLDGEFMAVDDAGDYLPRRELATFRGNSPVDDSNLRFVVFDALHIPGKGNVTSQPMAQRRRLLERWWKSEVEGKGFKRLVLGPRRIAKTRSALRRAIDWASKQPGSEGAMLKHLTATYSLGGENDLFAKVKAVREVKALVLDREGVEGRSGVFNFGCAVGPVSKTEAEQWKEAVEVDGKYWVKIGRTGNRKLDAKPGDVLLVQVLEILWEEGPPNRVRWFGPAQAIEVIESRPSSLNSVKNMLVDGEFERRGGAEKLAKFMKTERRFRVVKAEEKNDERYVFGVVLVPNEPDAQGDIYDEKEVEKACHSFLEHFGGKIKIMHKGQPVDGVIPIENYVTKQPEDWGTEVLPMGTWMLATRVKNDDVWQDVLDDTFTGYSMGGTALREALSPERP